MRSVFDRLLALPCALLPKRYWQSINLPVPDMAVASAFVTMAIGFVLGIRGYFAYLERLRVSGVGILDIAEMQVQGKLPETAAVSAIPTALAATAHFTYAFFTPLGLFCTYLVLSSIARLAASFTGEPFGDPIMTGADALARRTLTTQQQRSTRVAREKLEGAVEPDRRYAGDWAGLKDVDFVIVAARRKPDWTKGTWVLTPDDGWFVLGEAFDRPTPNGLRTVYPLTLQKTLEPMRRSVEYRFPALRSASAAKGRSGATRGES